VSNHSGAISSSTIPPLVDREHLGAHVIAFLELVRHPLRAADFDVRRARLDAAWSFAAI
jgi:hypothetical protein